MSINQKQAEAHILYRTKDPKQRPFTLMHCYLELEQFPKQQTRSSLKKQKKTFDASPGRTSTDDDIGACTDDLETETRPLGSKEKERLRKAKAAASDGSGSKLSLETVWAQKLEKDQIKEAAKTARYERAFELQERQIALQEKEEARKQLELEDKIMSMVTSAMSVGQKQFYEDKQDEIIARRYNTSG